MNRLHVSKIKTDILICMWDQLFITKFDFENLFLILFALLLFELLNQEIYRLWLTLYKSAIRPLTFT